MIFGSVTHSWNRKLKMMDANMFSMLALSERDDVAWPNKRVIGKIKEGSISLIN